MEKKDFNGPVLEAVAVDVLSTWNHQVRLQGVDWTVLPGEYWVIGGRHGTGKTDLLLTAAGLHRPTAGVLRLFGRDVTGLSEGELLQQRTRVGIVFKGGGRMFNELTVAENVALPVCYHRNCTPEEAQEEVDRTLDDGINAAGPGKSADPGDRLATTGGPGPRPGPQAGGGFFG